MSVVSSNKLLFWSLVFFFSLIQFVVVLPATSTSAVGANPFCWGDREIDCQTSINKEMIENATGSPPQVGKCYGFGFGIVEVAYNSQDCSDARAEMAVVAGQNPKCFTLDDTKASYNGSSFNPAGLVSVPCDDAIRLQFKALYHDGYNLEQGSCYIIASDGPTSQTCQSHDSTVRVAQLNGDGGGEEGGGGGAGGGGGEEEASVAVPTETTKNDCQDGLTKDNCGIIKWIVAAIQITSVIAGVVIIGAIVVGGIQYSTSGDDPQAVAKAKGRIYNAVLALVVFVFGFAFLQWIVPGGIV